MHPERSKPDRAHEFLAAGLVAHAGFLMDGSSQPYVIPMTYHFDPEEPDHLYLHGGAKSRAMDCLVAGRPVCVTVTVLDGLVAAKTALHHSMNYRSVVVFGTGHPLEDPAKKAAVLEKMISRYWPGRTAGVDYSAPSEGHLKITTVADIHIESMSAKTREGGANGPGDDDPDVPGTAGVTPIRAY